jgi:hypothetical protein
MRSRRWRSIQSGLPESAHGSPELVKDPLFVEVDGMSRSTVGWTQFWAGRKPGAIYSGVPVADRRMAAAQSCGGGLWHGCVRVRVKLCSRHESQQSIPLRSRGGSLRSRRRGCCVACPQSAPREERMHPFDVLNAVVSNPRAADSSLNP